MTGIKKKIIYLENMDNIQLISNREQLITRHSAITLISHYL